jgi:hypothetical protein
MAREIPHVYPETIMVRRGKPPRKRRDLELYAVNARAFVSGANTASLSQK